jgi:ferrous iron transport protein A
MPYLKKNLSELQKGRRAVVRHISGGQAFCNRLLVLGFTIGAEILVKQNPGFGPVIVYVKESRIALGRGEAAKVLVEEIGQE